MRKRVLTDEQILVSAVRYALGRATYMVMVTVDAVRGAWPELSESARAVIVRDIADALAQTPPGKHLGMDMDHRLWTKLYSDIQDGTITASAETEDAPELGPDEGYPSEAELRALLAFRGSAKELVEYAESLWRNGAGTLVEQVVDRWGRTQHRVTFVTGGWSGCESVIGALNSTLAFMYAVEWQRGGLHVYEFPDDAWNREDPWDWAFAGGDDELTKAQGPFAAVRDRLHRLEQVDETA